jgi:hypothetical protein
MRATIRKANRLTRQLKQAGSPITGEQAAALHALLSSTYYLPVDLSKRFYLKAGYRPFDGYPLTHK